MRMEVVTLRLSGGDRWRLAELCRRHNCTQSDILRHGLELVWGEEALPTAEDVASALSRIATTPTRDLNPTP